MWIPDSVGTLIQINQACTELLEAPERDVVGMCNILNDNSVRGGHSRSRRTRFMKRESRGGAGEQATELPAAVGPLGFALH